MSAVPLFYGYYPSINKSARLGKNVVMVNSDARESIAQLKGALLTLAQPLVSVIVPAFTLLVKVITAVVLQITRLVALISGKSVKATADSAKALNKQTNALKGTGNAAKKLLDSLRRLMRSTRFPPIPRITRAAVHPLTRSRLTLATWTRSTTSSRKLLMRSC